MIQTHRYTRNQLTEGTFDAYDSLSSRYPQSNSQLEYWTNGTTTHLMTTPPPSQEKTSHVVAPVMKKRKRSIVTPPTPGADNIIRNSIAAGSLSGIASTLAVYPFDVLRTKMQAQGSHQPGPIQVLRQTVQHGGMRALYTGLSLPLQAQAIYKATVFGINQVCQRTLLDSRKWELQKRGIVPNSSTMTLTLSDHYVCGFIGGAINAAAFVTPVEFVRNQLIVQHTAAAAAAASTGNAMRSTASGPMDIIRSTVATEGVRGLWRGMGMTVARDSLGCGFFFVSMAYCRQLFTKKGERPTLGVTVLSGACAGLGFWAIALPLDTLKTWVQNGTAASASEAVKGSLSSHGWIKTGQQLCRGWQVAFGRGAPSAAITISTYEFFYRKMEQI